MTRQKRYYNIDEKVWMIGEQRPAFVVGLHLDSHEVDLEFKNNHAEWESTTLKLWDIDKFRDGDNEIRRDTVYFSKVSESAKIPTKRIEDAGYDIYVNFEEDTIHIPRGTVKTIGTGIATYMPHNYCFVTSLERGSVGNAGIALLSGVVDSTYQGELFLQVLPTEKDLVITKDDNYIKSSDKVFWSYDKALAQGLFIPVPQLNVEVIDYDELKGKPSSRGDGKLGSTGK